MNTKEKTNNSILIDQIAEQIARLKKAKFSFYINYWNPDGSNGLTIVNPCGSVDYLGSAFFGVQTEHQGLYVYPMFEDFFIMNLESAINDYHLAYSDIEPILYIEKPLDFINRIAISPTMNEEQALKRLLEFLSDII